MIGRTAATTGIGALSTLLSSPMLIALIPFKHIHSLLSNDNCLYYYLLFTGADVLIAAEIKVAFVQPLSDFLRCPVVHTCGCLLELSNSYGSYLELAEELNNVLDSKIWVMDIV